MFRAAGILVRSSRSPPRVRLFTHCPFNDKRIVTKRRGLEWFKHSFNLEESQQHKAILKALKKANPTPLCPTSEEGVGVLTLPMAAELDCSLNCVQPSSLYIRESFYRRYFDLLWKTDWSVVIGIPNSWFQWYILYCLVNKKVVPTLGRNHLDVNTPPKVIARQVGDSSLILYFPHYDTAFKATCRFKYLLQALRPSSLLYLVEPDSHKPCLGKFQTIIISCSPDQSHYKEYVKRGARRRYMPCWTLNELQLVGAHVRSKCEARLQGFYSPEEIEKRYEKFGGIIRNVIPKDDSLVDQVDQQLNSALKHTTLFDLSKVAIDNEGVDHLQKSITPFILHYDVQYGDRHDGDSDLEFTKFTTSRASEHVYAAFLEKLRKMTDQQFVMAVDYLLQMFNQAVQPSPLVFEVVTAESIVRKYGTWRVFQDGSWCEHVWPPIEKISSVAKYFENVEDMVPGVLYYPADRRFPLLDFVYVEEEQKEKENKQVFGIQFAFAESHSKPVSVYEKAFSRLGLEKNDELRIYVVPSPRHAKTYVERKDFTKQFFTAAKGDQLSTKGFEGVNFSIVDVKFPDRCLFIN